MICIQNHSSRDHLKLRLLYQTINKLAAVYEDKQGSLRCHVKGSQVSTGLFTTHYKSLSCNRL